MQSTVNQRMGFGVPGDLYSDAPRRAESAIVASASGNKVGYAYTYSAEGAVGVGGAGVFCGIAINSKALAGQSLATTDEMAQYQNGEFLQEGDVIVELDAASSIGYTVYYTTATGALGSVAPGGPLPVGTANAYGKVIRFIPDAVGAQLAVVHFDVTPEVL